MKNTQSLSLILTAILTLSACSSATKTQTAAIDDVNLDEYLTERAIAQVQAGGEILVKMIGAATSATEKQALVRMIERTAQEQGISTVKGLQLSAKNVATAFSEQEAATIVKAISKAQPSLFSRPAFKQISAEADASLAKATAAQKTAGVQMTSNINLADKALQADVKNIHYGFNKNPEYTKVYIAVRKNTGVSVWSKATCTTYGKLDSVAAANLLTLGKNQAQVSKSVASIASGEKASQCMIKKGSVQALNDIVNVLHVPANQATSTLQLMTAPCNLLPESYAKVGAELVQANNGRIPAVSEVQCN